MDETGELPENTVLNPAHRVQFAIHAKGKVERMVSYVKDNFLAGRSFPSLEDLNAQGRSWLDTTANLRIHATTGARPIDLLEVGG